MTHVSWGIYFYELAKIRYYGGINFAEVGRKHSTKWLHDREKKRKMTTKIASIFPNEGNQNNSRSNGDFQILEVINFHKFGLNLRKPQSSLLPKVISYIIVLKTNYFRLPLAYLVSRIEFR